MNTDGFAEWFLASGIVVLLLALVAGVLAVMFFLRTNDERRLQIFLNEYAQSFLSHVVLPDGLGDYIFADYLLLHEDTIVVLNVMHKRGYVFGGKNIDEWTCVENHTTEKFKNPLPNLNMFAHAIQHELGFSHVETYLLFDSQSDFAKGVPEGVLQLNSLQDMLEKGAEKKDASEETLKAWQQLKSLSDDTKILVGER